MQFYESIKEHKPETPPVVVRLVMMGAYGYISYLAYYMFTSPFATPDKAHIAAVVTAQNLVLFVSTYMVDVLLALSPMRWCCMRSIPPINIVKHHVPMMFA